MTISDSKQDNDKKLGVGAGLLYLLIGGGIGATVALLFAAKSGAVLRNEISDVTRKRYDETLEMANRIKEQADEVYHSIREQPDRVYDVAAASFSLAKERMDDSLDPEGGNINGETHATDHKPARQAFGTGRRPSTIL